MLRVVDLSGTQLSAAGLKVLTQLPAIQQLSLYTAKRVDDGIVAILADMPQLTWVDLTGTSITAAAVEQLKQQRPKLRIVWEPST